MGKSFARKPHPNENPQENLSEAAPKFSWLHSCRKLTGVHEPLKHALVKGKDSVASVSKESVMPLAGAASIEAEPSLRACPPEPMELDCPIRCPQPEPVIIHDGENFKKSLQVPIRTGSELVFLTEKDLHNLTELRRQFTNKESVFPYASAPEPTISSLLDES